ncbi:MAG: sodium:solute symporter family protein [Chloroflexi bacterium]|nr:sodium:solute symporter family protein [Chloroflexota bacterium]
MTLAGYTITFGVIYLIATLAIGVWAWKKTANTPEDFFMASRSFGTMVLLWSIFATNMSAVFILGNPGQAYRTGAGAYGYMATATAIGVVFMTYFIGYRAWLLGKARGYMTPTEMFSRRWDSQPINIVLFLMYFVFTIGIAMTAIMGVGLTTEALTDKIIPFWAGSVAAAVVILIYTAIGGMRGTAWTNVLQGFLFQIFLVGAFLLIAGNVGGLDAVTNKLLSEAPQLLAKQGNYTPQQWFSWVFIPPMAVLAFPHVFVRVMAAKSHVAIKRYTYLFSIVYLLGAIPVLTIGLWGRALIPGLQGPASDSILPMMAARYLHPVVAGFALAAVLSAAMSTLDAMVLTLSALFTRDILGSYTRMSERQQTNWGRILVVVFTLAALVGALTRPGTIFYIAGIAFTGYVMTVPMIFAGFYWKRSTKWGILSALVVSSILLPIYEFTPWLAWSTFGFMSVVPLLVVNVVLIVGVSYLTKAPEKRFVDEFFDVLDPIFSRKPAKAPELRPGEA